MKTRLFSRSGFTLLEVLFGVFCLSIVMLGTMAMLGSMNQGVNNNIAQNNTNNAMHTLSSALQDHFANRQVKDLAGNPMLGFTWTQNNATFSNPSPATATDGPSTCGDLSIFVRNTNTNPETTDRYDYTTVCQTPVPATPDLNSSNVHPQSLCTVSTGLISQVTIAHVNTGGFGVMEAQITIPVLVGGTPATYVGVVGAGICFRVDDPTACVAGVSGWCTTTQVIAELGGLWQASDRKHIIALKTAMPATVSQSAIEYLK